MTSPLLDVHDLSVRITRDEGVVRPLNGVSFRINTGQAVGIVGESGCGKTMTSNALLQILPPAAEITSGHICYRRKLDEREIDLAALDDPRLNIATIIVPRIFDNIEQSLRPALAETILVSIWLVEYFQHMVRTNVKKERHHE